MIIQNRQKAKALENAKAQALAKAQKEGLKANEA
jgi:hypothetical protein